MNRAEQERQYGLHSNIPKCCVEYYLHLLKHGVQHPGIFVRKKFPQLHRGPWWHWPQYVTCPSCSQLIIIGKLKPNELHHCDDSCPRFL